MFGLGSKEPGLFGLGSQGSSNDFSREIQDRNVRSNLADWKARALEAEGVLRATRVAYVDNGLAAMAGLRSVIRELLVELKNVDPKNPLLGKKVRDEMFMAAEKIQRGRQAGLNYCALGEHLPKFRDEAYGAKNADRGGPEFSEITPNLEIRKAANFPTYTPIHPV